MKVLIDIPEDIYNHIIVDSEYFTPNLVKAFRNGTPIPDNATNGDVVNTVFSNTFDNFCERTTWEWYRWWNSPYQKGGKE